MFGVVSFCLLQEVFEECITLAFDRHGELVTIELNAIDSTTLHVRTKHFGANQVDEDPFAKAEAFCFAMSSGLRWFALCSFAVDHFTWSSPVALNFS